MEKVECPDKTGNQYENQTKQYLESLGFLHIASNIVVRGGEVDLLMQSSVQLSNDVFTGELCIVSAKGRKKGIFMECGPGVC